MGSSPEDRNVLRRAARVAGLLAALACVSGLLWVLAAAWPERRLGSAPTAAPALPATQVPQAAATRAPAPAEPPVVPSESVSTPAALAGAATSPGVAIPAQGAPAAIAPAAALTPAVAKPANGVPPKSRRTPAQLKIDSNLLRIILQVKNAPGTGGSTLVVDISARVGDDLLARIKGLGAEIISADPPSHSIRARVSPGAVETIAGYDDVVFVQLAQEPLTN